MHLVGNLPGGRWLADTARAMNDFAAERRRALDAAAQAGRFERDIYREMGVRGWVGSITPTEYGGEGGGTREYCAIEEEAARTLLISPQISVQGQHWLLHWGTADQRDRYLRGIATGELIFSESISEPGAGSSFKSIRAGAVRDGSDWVISGRKTHVNLGAESDVTLVYANTSEGLTAFLVDCDSPGFSAKTTDPVGLRLIPTADVHLDEVRVPADAVLAAPGEGLATFLSTFNTSRLGNASELIGLGRRAMADAVTYGTSRQVGDNVVTDFQGIQWTVAEAYSKLYAASLARDFAADLAEAGNDHALQSSLAKRLAIEAAEYATNESFALVGGHGLYIDEVYSRLLLDVKVLRVAGGSVEVLRNHIARSVLRSAAFEVTG
jgi:alkylation response protein AidB-like acyl-CoA dehydrogenase